MRGSASGIRKNVQRSLLALANLAEPSQFRQLLAKAFGRVDTEQVRSSVEHRADAGGRQDMKVVVEGDVDFIKQGIEVAIDGKQLEFPVGLLSLRGRGPVADFGTWRGKLYRHPLSELFQSENTLPRIRDTSICDNQFRPKIR